MKTGKQSRKKWEQHVWARWPAATISQMPNKLVTAVAEEFVVGEFHVGKLTLSGPEIGIGFIRAIPLPKNR